MPGGRPAGCTPTATRRRRRSATWTGSSRTRRTRAEPWLEASGWQARGQAADAFRDFGQAAIRFASAGDIMHASNVRYMMASRAVETAERLAEVPVWLDECESYAAGHGYRHELAGHGGNYRAAHSGLVWRHIQATSAWSSVSK
jgi:hypothetical protein